MDQPAPPRRRVYLIDDDADVRKSLHFLLGVSSITAWPFAESADFLDQLDELPPAPILLDIRMPRIDGLQMLALLKEREITWPVIMMTAHGDIAVAVRAMKLGAIEFLEKPFEPDLLEQALDQAYGVLGRIERTVQSRRRARQLLGQLSRRESEVLTILMEGVPNKIAAHRLDLSPRTVEMHRGNALAKLGLKSIAEAVALVTAADLGGHPLGWGVGEI
ncbi:response regulator [Novosphingobium sp.]|uniref:response regulator transcription factor n=1 Tax=Novosphingobium sp. TaxID=1874826 RepID=UPI00260EACB5|nr:response regulator [Novosphingobium sp.]